MRVRGLTCGGGGVLLAAHGLALPARATEVGQDVAGARRAVEAGALVLVRVGGAEGGAGGGGLAGAGLAGDGARAGVG